MKTTAGIALRPLGVNAKVTITENRKIVSGQ
jgi:hypothetical protein